MTELRSSQRNPERMFTDEENRVWSLQKRSNRFTQFGYTDLTLVLGCSIKFIDSDFTLMSVCCASRDCYALLRPEALKQSLLRASPERLEVKRPLLWKALLQVSDNVDEEFAEHLELA
jgi:hypothetical protein